MRAINVGGRVVKMDTLRGLCEGCGLSSVETFIASGNVIFDSRVAPATLESRIEGALRKGLGYEVATFVRSVPELAAVVKTAEKKARGAKHVYVGFLRATPAPADQGKAAAVVGTGERIEFAGREVYWLTDGGVSDSKFSYAVLERLTGSPATFRNITTVRKIVEKYS